MEILTLFRGNNKEIHKIWPMQYNLSPRNNLQSLNGASRPIYKDRRMGMEIFNTVCPTNILLTKVKKLRKQ